MLIRSLKQEPHSGTGQLIAYRKRERFAELNICGFSLIKFSRKYFRGALATSSYYLPKVKNLRENFRGKLINSENCKSLTQQIFSCLRYMTWGIYGISGIHL